MTFKSRLKSRGALFWRDECRPLVFMLMYYNHRASSWPANLLLFLPQNYSPHPLVVLLGLPRVQFGTAAVLPQPKTASEREVRGQPLAPGAWTHRFTFQRKVNIRHLVTKRLPSPPPGNLCSTQWPLWLFPEASSKKPACSRLCWLMCDHFQSMQTDSLFLELNLGFTVVYEVHHHHHLSQASPPWLCDPVMVGSGSWSWFHAWFTWKDWCRGSFLWWILISVLKPSSLRSPSGGSN